MLDTSWLGELKQLHQKVENMRSYLDVSGLEKDIVELDSAMIANGFWDDRENSKRVLTERKQKSVKVQSFKQVEMHASDAVTLAELAVESDDEATLNEVHADLAALSKEVKMFELSTLLSGEYDANNAILSIHAGAGGTEAQDWTDMLFRMYLRWFENKKFSADVIDMTPGEEAGTKSVVIDVKGPNAFGFLRSEKGIHRLVRISPFDANKRRHTSFSAVDVIPEIEDNIHIEIDLDDLRIDTFRASGAGGQNVNKLETAIRITHLPTNIVVQCQNERSQFKNKEGAMRILRARIFEQRRREHEQKVSEIQGELKENAWGSQIRNYVFHPYNMVKDLRTRVETGNTQAVMDGDIDDFIWAFLEQEAAAKAKS